MLASKSYQSDPLIFSHNISSKERKALLQRETFKVMSHKDKEQPQLSMPRSATTIGHIPKMSSLS